MADLNKKLLAEKIAENYDLTKKVSLEIVNTVFDTMTETLKEGNKVDISGFGKFVVKTKEARQGINPFTKEVMEFPASRSCGFKASKVLKDSLK